MNNERIYEVKEMSLTQKSIRITLAAVFSIIAANMLSLANPMAAGIIAILSILDTRLETVQTALERFLSTILAFAVATGVFLLFGFSVYSFGIYLAIYVPLAYLFKVDAGISPCSVLVTHFVIAGSVSLSWQINGYGLMLLGLVFALIFNLWLPSYDKQLEEHVVGIERQMSLILFLLQKRLVDGAGSIDRVKEELKKLCDLTEELEDTALVEYENTPLTGDSKDYYVKYGQMRKRQYDILDRMTDLLTDINLKTEANNILASIFGETAEQLDEQNTGEELLEKLARLYQIFRDSPLPETREEFEIRAILFYIMTDFEKFLELKRDFYFEYSEKDNNSQVNA